MSVTVSGRSGLTNAYRSVVSATGSLEISGASRCDDIPHLFRNGARLVAGDSARRFVDQCGKAFVIHRDLPIAGVDRHLTRVYVAQMRDNVTVNPRAGGD